MKLEVVAPRVGPALLAVTALVCLLPQPTAAQQIQIRDLCRVKGQEENTLHGLGLVVGLDGTGDNETPTIRALAKMLELMGNPVAENAPGQWDIEELSNTRNVAMVFVTATVPAEGARQGDTLHCEVNAINASSLSGGYLMLTPLLGPRPGSTRVYAVCHGPISLDQRAPETTGKVHRGCRLEADIKNSFFKDGRLSLVVDDAHASCPNRVRAGGQSGQVLQRPATRVG